MQERDLRCPPADTYYGKNTPTSNIEGGVPSEWMDEGILKKTSSLEIAVFSMLLPSIAPLQLLVTIYLVEITSPSTPLVEGIEWVLSELL